MKTYDKIIISLDDLWDGNDHWSTFESLAEEFPGFKATFFVITGKCSDEFLKKVKQPWSELVFHSWEHSGAWKNWSKEETKEWLEKFQSYGFEKGFKAPAYKWTDNIIDACNEMGYWMCSSPTIPINANKYWYTHPNAGLMYYDDYAEYYDHFQNEKFHENIEQLRQFCRDNQPEFKFISEVIKTK